MKRYLTAGPSSRRPSARCIPLWSLILIAAFTSVALGQGPHLSHGTASAAAPGTSGRVVLGDVIPFGDGTARAWVEVGADGQPLNLGVTLTEAALNNLPARMSPGIIWTEFILDLPDDVPMLPFDHIGVNWNPRGHPPHGIYNVPHFDFHFYLISPEQRENITARGADLEQCSRAPGLGHMPAEYVFAPDSEEPGMGGHWVDPASHEFHGADFTSTFLYGTHDGRIIFWEPMITMAYLKSTPNVNFDLKLPEKYEVAGYYPRSYGIHFDAARKEYSVMLLDLAMRN